jgi:protein required for attachment to host cells
MVSRAPETGEIAFSVSRRNSANSFRYCLPVHQEPARLARRFRQNAAICGRDNKQESSMSHIRLKHGIWVVVADGEKALFLRNRGDATYPDLSVIRTVEEENPATREQGADRPGRFNDGPSVHRSAVEETDWHRIAKERFADEIAARLYKAAHRGDFDELVLVAPPVVLGQMRKSMHKEVLDRLKAEVPKTLTNMPVGDIEKHLTQA